MTTRITVFHRAVPAYDYNLFKVNPFFQQLLESRHYAQLCPEDSHPRLCFNDIQGLMPFEIFNLFLDAFYPKLVFKRKRSGERKVRCVVLAFKELLNKGIDFKESYAGTARWNTVKGSTPRPC